MNTQNPEFVIKPSKPFIFIDLKELWYYRELFYFLVWKQVKIRYKQSFLGVAWAILQPLMTMVVFTLIFGNLAGLPSDGHPNTLFYFSGLVAWTFFAQSLAQSTNSLVGNISLVNKIYCPRLIIPVSVILACMFDMFIALACVFPMLPIFSYYPGLHILALPFMILYTLMVCMGVGYILSALTVKYRDFRYVSPFLAQFWMFCSPVAYGVQIIPADWHTVYALNPMTGAILGFRWALLGNMTNSETGELIMIWPMVAIGFAITVVLLLISVFYFQRTERYFADLI